MRKIICICFVFVISGIASSQTSKQSFPKGVKQANKGIKTKSRKDNKEKICLLSKRMDFAPISSEYKLFSNGMSEQIIGKTYYDLQTNNSIQNRLFVHDDNTISATWTMSPDIQTDFPNRGTGYNYFDGTSWMDIPESRIEEERTGWSSIAGINGGEIVTSHVYEDPNTFTNIASRTEKGSGEWSEKHLPNTDANTNYKNVWPRMKVGGADGQSVHIISHTYNNTDSTGVSTGNFITYSRSQDGGESFDIIDYLLPEIGPEFYTNFDADTYAMDVKGNTVAFVLGDAWTDVILMKSTDNGTTWTKTIVKEHPIPMWTDSVIVNSLNYPEYNGRIESTDRSFSISLDNDGNAHIFYGLMKYSNFNDPNDEEGAYTYYYTTDGLAYWNEISKTEQEITYVEDLNDNDTLDIQIDDEGNYQIAKYEKSLVSYPSSVIAENGDIYLTYSGIIEHFYPEQIEMGNTTDGENFLQHYRHMYIIRSQDGGASWSTPYDLMTEVTDPEIGDPLQEGVYGCISNIVNDTIYLIYQRDVYPGLNIQGDEDPITKNSIVFMTIPVEVFETLATKEITNATSNLSIYPNPASNRININLGNNKEISKVIITNVLGEVVKTTMIKGESTQLSIEELINGVYFVSVETTNQVTTKSLVKK
jgi:hypothetical protein